VLERIQRTGTHDADEELFIRHQGLLDRPNN
jgi:hypothetical protein